MRKRNAISQVASCASMVSKVPTPNATVLSTMMRLRPIRSAMVPNSIAPIMRPNRPALNTGPSAPRASFHSCATAGAT